MQKAGVYLIYASVVLRGLVRLAGEPSFRFAAGFLAAYGILLVLAETLWVPHGPPSASRAERPASLPGPGAGPSRRGLGLAVAYLLAQLGLVIGLLLLPPILDLFGLLLVPLAIEAVFFFGRRIGFLAIGFFFPAMLGPMLLDERGWVFALTMTVLNIGYCLLFSGYALQVQRAEAARENNRRILGELQVAHRQLQGYAVQVEGLAAERERNRLARELHDSVTQTVFSMSLTVQSARVLLREPARAAGQLVRLEELAAGAMAEIRALVTRLQPRSVAQEGLPAALHRLAAERQARDGLQVTVEVAAASEGEDATAPGAGQALAGPVAEGLYHIAQEALANVAKHAGTRRATVRLRPTGGAWLEVQDDGLGFDPGAAFDRHGHLGLAGMAERAREIGWRLSVESRPEGGTRIRVEERPAGGGA